MAEAPALEVCPAMPESAPVMALIPFPLARPFLFGLDPEHAHDLTLGGAGGDPAHAADRPGRAGARARPGDDRRPGLSRTASAWPRGSTRTAAASTPSARWASASSRSARSRRARSRAIRSRACSASPRPTRSSTGSASTTTAWPRSSPTSGGRAFAPAAASSASTSARTRRRRSSAPPTTTSLGLAGVYPHADYVTVNISSPNTQNLRTLQSRRGARRPARRARSAARTSSPTSTAAACRCSSRSRPTSTRRRSKRSPRSLARHRHRRRHRDQHDARPRRRRRPRARARRAAACRARRLLERSNSVIAGLRAALGAALSDHRRRRRHVGRRCACQARGRRRPRADLHGLHLQGPGAGDGRRARARRRADRFAGTLVPTDPRRHDWIDRR